MSNRERVLVVCPGRGSYGSKELGVLQSRRDHFGNFFKKLEGWRAQEAQESILELDAAERFSASQHTKGENASLLIHACAVTDFWSISRDHFDVVAVAGNSMGWYSALAAAGAVDDQMGIELVNTMGSMMKDGVIGAQCIYSVVDEHWLGSEKRLADLDRVMFEVADQFNNQIHLSIDLGGYRVLAGSEPAVQALMDRLPVVDERYPFRLVNHGAFHTPLMSEISQRALDHFSGDRFQSPQIPLIDGRGAIWQPYSSDPGELLRYTLEHQVLCTYEFSRSIEVALKEFAPKRIILLGPGDTLGGAIGQVLVSMKWQGIRNKDDFVDRQKSDPVLLAMGRDEQRRICVEGFF